MYFNKEKTGLFVDASLVFDSKKSESISIGYQGLNIEKYFKYNSFGVAIPVNVGYKLKISNAFALYAAAGPYVDFGLGGKVKEVTVTFAEDGYTKVGNPKEQTVSSNIYKDKLFKRLYLHRLLVNVYWIINAHKCK